jgi:ABC-type phosphate transport system substrate-binding protein
MKRLMTFNGVAAMRVLGFAVCLASAATQADVVAVVSAKSETLSLSKDQLADIFLGRVSRLPNGMLAVPIDLAEGAPLRAAFYAKVADRSPAQMKAHWSRIIFTGRGLPPKSVATSVELKKLIAANPGSIGYMDETDVDSSVRVLKSD